MASHHSCTLAHSHSACLPSQVLLGCLSGVGWPQLYTAWYKPVYITSMLAVTMLCMGFTLSVDDMTGVFKTPARVATGAALQYTIMPTLGFLISRMPGMSPPFAAGIILVACCPGGTASNIITYLAKADVGLSVMMTTASTLAAVVMTPLLTTQLIGTMVPVNGMALFVSTLQVLTSLQYFCALCVTWRGQSVKMTVMLRAMRALQKACSRSPFSPATPVQIV